MSVSVSFWIQLWPRARIPAHRVPLPAERLRRKRRGLGWVSTTLITALQKLPPHIRLPSEAWHRLLLRWLSPLAPCPAGRNLLSMARSQPREPPLLLLHAGLLPLLLSQLEVVAGAECRFVLRDAFRCSGAGIDDLAALRLPTNATQVFITETGAAELPDGLFSEMAVLQLLLLSSNQLAAISPGAFRGLVHLKTLKLNHNKIGRLPGGVFAGLLRLQMLVLEDNRLQSLPPDLLDPLRNLQELFLNRNFLTSLPEGLFRNLVRLRLLNLSRNQLAALPGRLFSSLAGLQKLSLYGNPLAALEPGLFAGLGGRLLELRLHSCALQALGPEAFDGLAALQTLTLSGNRLPGLPEGLFLPLRNLTLLTLHRNPLLSLPRRLFGTTPGLRSLWLYETELATLPAGMLSNLTQLEVLVLTLNPRLGHLPRGAFQGLGHLEALSLHSNNLSGLPGGVFAGLDRLRELSLFGNRMESLPLDAFGRLESLESLYLNGTGLRFLPGQIFAALPALRTLRLDGNPWHCHCPLAELAAWLRSKPGLVRSAPAATAATCHSPPALRHLPLSAFALDPVACLLTPAGSLTPPGPSPDPSEAPAVSPTALADLLSPGPWEEEEEEERVPPSRGGSPASGQGRDPPATGVRHTQLPWRAPGPIGGAFFVLHLLALATQALAVGLAWWGMFILRRAEGHMEDQAPPALGLGPFVLPPSQREAGAALRGGDTPPAYYSLRLVLR